MEEAGGAGKSWRGWGIRRRAGGGGVGGVLKGGWKGCMGRVGLGPGAPGVWWLVLVRCGFLCVTRCRVELEQLLHGFYSYLSVEQPLLPGGWELWLLLLMSLWAPLTSPGWATRSCDRYRFATESVRMNDSLTRTNRPDSTFQFSLVRLVCIVCSLRLDSQTHPLFIDCVKW